MTGHFISSTTDLLGVELQAEVTKGKTTSQSTTTLWYGRHNETNPVSERPHLVARLAKVQPGSC